MKIEPVITEKSMNLAKDGHFTFFVDRGLTKPQIKKIISHLFKVTVVKVRIVNLKGEVKKTMKGRKKIIRPRKKAVVTLKDKEKIDLFEEKKKKK